VPPQASAAEALGDPHGATACTQQNMQRSLAWQRSVVTPVAPAPLARTAASPIASTSHAGVVLRGSHVLRAQNQAQAIANRLHAPLYKVYSQGTVR
jgi:hypothetical protein